MLDMVIRVCSLTFSHPAHKGADGAELRGRAQRPGRRTNSRLAPPLHYAEPPSNPSSVERNLAQICVLARPTAELVTPPAMRHHAKTSATAITDLRFAILSHDTLVLGFDTFLWSTRSGILQ
jgi:hypothetical protein